MYLGEGTSGGDLGESPRAVWCSGNDGSCGGEDPVHCGGIPGVREDELPHSRDKTLTEGAVPRTEGLHCMLVAVVLLRCHPLFSYALYCRVN